MRYTLIGASLRGELLEPHPSVLRQRVAAALSGGAVPSNPKPRERWADRWARPLLGVGIAATVAIVAVGTLRSLNEAAFAPGAATTPSAGIPLQVRDPVTSYVVPQGADEEQSRIVAPRLANYLMHHGEFASRLTRTSVNSNVVGAVMEPVVTDAPAVSKPVIEEELE
jgi:negative regulator of sigma E activity